MKIAVREQRLVMVFYGITLFVLLVTITDWVPMNLFPIMTKIKYVFILVMIMLNLRDGMFIISRRFIIAAGVLLVHTVIYGIILLNPNMVAFSRLHFEQLMTVYLIIIVLCHYVYKNDCFLEFLHASFMALSLFILVSAILYPGDFVNPIYYINVFSDTGRYRTQFGMSNINFCGNYCLYTILCSLFLLHEWKKEKTAVSVWSVRYVLASSAVCLMMLFSTASRSAIICLALFCMIWWALVHEEFLYRRRKTILISGVIIVLSVLIIGNATGAIADFWEASNREGNFTINYPFFKEYGNYLNGMGYSDNSDFYEMNYGYPTTAMDVYYLYIFFTTGIIGSAMILFQMLYVLYHLIRYKNIKGRNMALSLFLVMLFYAVWQVNYMNYRYYTSLFHMTVLFQFLMRIGTGRDDIICVIKRR